MNLGIDFGSTNSMLSYYDNDQKQLKAAKRSATDSEQYIPSVVCRKSKKSNDFYFGELAKKTSDKKPDLDAYRA